MDIFVVVGSFRYLFISPLLWIPVTSRTDADKQSTDQQLVTLCAVSKSGNTPSASLGPHTNVYSVGRKC